MKKIGRKLAVLLGLCGLAYGLVCIYFWAVQRDMIFEASSVMQTTPERVGLQYESIRIASGRGYDRGELSAWWLPAERSNLPTLLYLHGNYRNISHNLEHALRLHNMGYNILLVDYRGYGSSTGGQASEEKVYEDAEASWSYLVQQRKISPQQIVIYGHSLGGAIATNLAVHHAEAAGLIVESSFTSMQAMAGINYGYLPISWLLNQRFDSLSKISGLHIPLLIVHGTWDARVPSSMGKQLYERAPQPKYLSLIEGGEHSNNSGIANVEYRKALNDFTQKYVKQ